MFGRRDDVKARRYRSCRRAGPHDPSRIRRPAYADRHTPIGLLTCPPRRIPSLREERVDGDGRGDSAPRDAAGGPGSPSTRGARVCRRRHAGDAGREGGGRRRTASRAVAALPERSGLDHPTHRSVDVRLPSGPSTAGTHEKRIMVSCCAGPPSSVSALAQPRLQAERLASRHEAICDGVARMLEADHTCLDRIAAGAVRNAEVLARAGRPYRGVCGGAVASRAALDTGLVPRCGPAMQWLVEDPSGAFCRLCACRKPARGPFPRRMEATAAIVPHLLRAFLGPGDSDSDLATSGVALSLELLDRPERHARAARPWEPRANDDRAALAPIVRETQPMPDGSRD